MTNSARFWDRIADKYSQKPVEDVIGYENSLSRTREYLGPDKNVLEIGCGTGTTALFLCGDVKSYLATDISGGMIEIARQKLAKEDISNLTFEKADVFDASLESASFDVICAFNLIHLVPDVAAVYARVHSLLKPGGVFISKTALISDKAPLLIFPITIMRAFGKAPPVKMLKQKAVLEIAKQAGFETLLVEDHSANQKSMGRFIVDRKI